MDVCFEFLVLNIGLEHCFVAMLRILGVVSMV